MFTSALSTLLLCHWHRSEKLKNARLLNNYRTTQSDLLLPWLPLFRTLNNPPHSMSVFIHSLCFVFQGSVWQNTAPTVVAPVLSSSPVSSPQSSASIGRGRGRGVSLPTPSNPDFPSPTEAKSSPVHKSSGPSSVTANRPARWNAPTSSAPAPPVTTSEPDMFWGDDDDATPAPASANPNPSLGGAPRVTPVAAKKPQFCLFSLSATSFH